MTTWIEETTQICEPWFQLWKHCLSTVLSSPLHKQPRRNKPRSPKTSLFRSYLPGARSWEKQLWSVFPHHPPKQKYSHRAKENHLFYIQWFHQLWRAGSGPECEAESPPGRPSPPAPHGRGTQKLLPTTCNICLQLETRAKPCSPGSLYEWRTNALIWIYKNLHPIWGQPM